MRSAHLFGATQSSSQARKPGSVFGKIQNPTSDISSQISEVSKNEITSSPTDKRLYRSHPVLCQRCVSADSPQTKSGKEPWPY